VAGVVGGDVLVVVEVVGVCCTTEAYDLAGEVGFLTVERERERER